MNLSPGKNSITDTTVTFIVLRRFHCIFCNEIKMNSRLFLCDCQSWPIVLQAYLDKYKIMFCGYKDKNCQSLYVVA